MSKPIIHAESSVRKFGGKVEDYMPIHELMDSSKAALADNRHRALTHTSWFISVILTRVFGETFVNSAGKTISTRDIGEQHVLEDFGGYIPTAQDFLQEIIFQPWMQNGKEPPPSSKNLEFYLEKTKKLEEFKEKAGTFRDGSSHLSEIRVFKLEELKDWASDIEVEKEIREKTSRIMPSEISLQERLLKLNTD